MQSDKAELQKAEFVGDHTEQKIFNYKTLTAFEKRLNNFTCNEDFDEQCLIIARQAFAIYNQYPQESIFRNAKLRNEEIDCDDENETIPMHKYISFWADSEGWLSDSLTDCINNDFNEYADVEEPTISKRFDGTALAGNNLNFESRLFDLLDELFYLLNTYKKQRNGKSK